MKIRVLLLKYRWPILLTIAVSLIAQLGLYSMPHNFRGLSFLGLFFLLDYYLWQSFRSTFILNKPIWIYLILGIYWLPLVIIVGAILNGFILPFYENPPLIVTLTTSILITGAVVKIPAFIALLCVDIYRGIKYAITRKPLHISGRSALVSGWIVSGLVLVLLVIGQTYWVHDFVVNRNKIAFSDLPEEFDGFRIVQLSDLHLGNWLSESAMDQLIDEVNGLNPDLIVFTGDMVTLSAEEMRPWLSSLAKLKAKYGEFAILGNHDYGTYISEWSREQQQEDLDKLCEYYRRIGWQLLRNQSVEIELGSESIALIGVENWSKSHLFASFGDLAKAVDGVETIPFKVLLSHDPTHWDEEVSVSYPDIDLTLSGHTHGGQFGFICCGLKLSPSALLFPNWKGLVEKSNQYLYVNVGAGSVGLAGRVGMRPEIGVIELYTKK